MGEHPLSPDSTGSADGEPAAVARSCSLKEALSNPKAKAALGKEWDRHRSIHTWDETVVRERADVQRKRDYGYVYFLRLRL
eukprot:2744764-Prorocentrum_lima.AAC.1